MKILGIPLRRPSFGDVTKSAILATAMLLILMTVSAFLGRTPRTEDKVTWLLLAFWGGVSSTCGLTPARGWRHLALLISVGIIIALAISVFSSLITLQR